MCIHARARTNTQPGRDLFVDRKMLAVVLLLASLLGTVLDVCLLLCVRARGLCVSLFAHCACAFRNPVRHGGGRMALS